MNVLAEMRSNQQSATRALEGVRGRRGDLQAFGAYLSSGEAAQDPDSVVALANLLMRTGGPQVRSAALDDALQSGNLRLIESAELRALLGSYADGIRILRERFDDHQDWTNQHVRSYLLEHGRREDHLGSSPSGPRSSDAPSDTWFPPSRFEAGGEALLADREFENHLRDQILWHVEIEGNVEGFLEAFAGAPDEIEGQLQR